MERFVKISFSWDDFFDVWIINESFLGLLIIYSRIKIKRNILNSFDPKKKNPHRFSWKALRLQQPPKRRIENHIPGYQNNVLSIYYDLLIKNYIPNKF